jgi:hypothetical protein
MAKRNIPAGMVKAGFQTISLANSTALGLNTTCIVGHFFHLSVETNSCRYRADGTNPALTTGVLLATGEHWLMDLATATAASLKFQRTTGTSKVSVMAYKYVGE